MKKEIDRRSKYWLKLCKVLEKEFPKGKCQERGHALVLLAYVEMFLSKLEEEKQKVLEEIENLKNEIRWKEKIIKELQKKVGSKI